MVRLIGISRLVDGEGAGHLTCIQVVMLQEEPGLSLLAGAAPGRAHVVLALAVEVAQVDVDLRVVPL